MGFAILEFRILGFSFLVWGLEFEVLGLESWSLGFRVCCLDMGFEFGGLSIRFQVWDFKFGFFGFGI